MIQRDGRDSIVSASEVSTREKLQGVIPPMITPFDTEGEIDKKALREVVSFLKTRVDGLFVCGSYGSGPLMSTEQRKTVVEITVEEVNGSIPVIVHVGAASTDTSVDLAIHAERSGANRVASVAPYYYTHGVDAIKHHFSRLVDAVSIPVYVYNNPKTVGYGITPQLAKDLESLGVKGIKDSSFDLILFCDYQRHCSPDFDVVMGTEALFWPASVVGAKAFIPGLGNAFPEVMRELYDASMARDTCRAMRLHIQALAMREAVHKVGATVVGVQTALHLRGINAGLPKAPFRPASEELKTCLLETLRSIGVDI